MFDQRRLGTVDHPGSAMIRSEPLAENLVITDATATAVCDAEGGFDLHAVLAEELPCGAIVNITDGIMRASGFTEVTVELAPTHYMATRGNPLCLILGMSSFPRFDFATRQSRDLKLQGARFSLNTTR